MGFGNQRAGKNARKKRVSRVESTQLRMCNKKERNSIKAFRSREMKHFEALISNILPIQVHNDHGKVKVNIFCGRFLGYPHAGTRPSSALVPSLMGTLGFSFFSSRAASCVVALPTGCRSSPKGLITKRFTQKLKSSDDDMQRDKLELVVESASNLR